jgi:hypothetical protein
VHRGGARRLRDSAKCHSAATVLPPSVIANHLVSRAVTAAVLSGLADYQLKNSKKHADL